MKKILFIIVMAGSIAGLSSCGSERCACNTFGAIHPAATQTSASIQQMGLSGQ